MKDSRIVVSLNTRLKSNKEVSQVLRALKGLHQIIATLTGSLTALLNLLLMLVLVLNPQPKKKRNPKP